jgi:cytoskeletal protein RodZ
MNDFLAKMKEFIKTPLGKVALTGFILLIVLFIAALLLGAFLIFSNLKSAPQEVPKAPVEVKKSTEGAKVTIKESTEETETPKSSGESSAAYEIYEYKDPFEPLIKETTSTTTTVTTPSEEEIATPSEEEETGPQVLEVQDIFTENGVKYASIKYGTTVYKVKEGERVDESPYEVLTIGTDSVVLLYGDNRVEVKVGESILK